MRELGEITRCWTITFQRRSKHPVAKLWKAITDPEQVARWMGYPARIDLRVGGDWYVDFNKKGQLDGVIVRLEEERRLAYVWGRSVVEWELEVDSDGCHFTFVHHGQTPGLSPSEEGLAAGWHAFLDAFERELDGLAFDAEKDHATTNELEPVYRERLQWLLS